MVGGACLGLQVGRRGERGLRGRGGRRGVSQHWAHMGKAKTLRAA